MVSLESRLSGDLIYLDVVTLEGNKYCITGTTKAFYVNSSTTTVLDPRPNKTGTEATTLIGLLQKISSRFKKGRSMVESNLFLPHPKKKIIRKKILLHFIWSPIVNHLVLL